VATGTALACGGYAVAILCYILNRWKYHPLIRSAILTSFFGYALAGFSVVIDLGRFWNAYNLFLPSRWQFNSVLFEVALCVMSYTVVLFIEFLPVILEKLQETGHEKARAWAEWLEPKIDRVLMAFIVLGITLPSMHQSSLGSMYLVAGTKLNPIWHTGFLPLQFLLNCVFLGYGVVIMESTLSSYAFRRPYEVRELGGLAEVAAWVAALWLVLRIGDLGFRGELGRAFAGDFYSLMFLFEIGLIGLGAAILARKERRRSPRFLYLSAVSIVLGGALYRFNVYLIGFKPHGGWVYYPSLAEFLITLGIIAFEVLAYLCIVKIFPVLPAGDVQVQANSARA
jgi:Ni/Fe-hydrogenase subunit HybB-like protein